jgi:UDP-glucose-4-epimerase GalE
VEGIRVGEESVLVTGGAGYIGAHTAKALAEKGFRPVVFDDLSLGWREAVRWGELIEGDVRDGAVLERAMRDCAVSAVVHFAGLIEVGRSVERPDLFFDVNVEGVRRVLNAMRAVGVRRLVFSSSAGVYGASGLGAPGESIPETAPKDPMSPYAQTKLAGEMMIGAYCAAFGMTGVALRYFNAAGSDPGGLIGEAHHPETHLIPLAADAALGRRAALTVYGTDYPTPDGSCIRDYVHVSDLARAHIAALELAMPDGAFEAMNIGSGRGYSVLEVIDAVSRAAGRAVPHSFGPRRAGDPPSLVADPGQAMRRLNWTPQNSSLDEIVRDAVAWRRAPAYGELASAGG